MQSLEQDLRTAYDLHTESSVVWIVRLTENAS